MKTKILILISAITFVACQKTSTAPNGNVAKATNASLWVTNYVDYTVPMDTVNGLIERGCTYYCNFYHGNGGTSYFPHYSNSPGFVLLNGDTIEWGLNQKSGGPTMNVTPVWKITGNTSEGVTAGTFTASPFPILSKITPLDTIHLHRNYVIKFTPTDADSVFIGITNADHQHKFAKGSIPSQTTFSPSELAFINGQWQLSTSIFITCTKYYNISFSNIQYAFQTSSSRSYYVSIVNN